MAEDDYGRKNNSSPPPQSGEGRELQVVNLGKIDYDLGLRLQRDIAKGVVDGEISDTLLLLEHPPVFTVGRGGKEKDILVSGKILEREGIQVFHIDRGGEVTYHGPGQIVGYPIIDLRYHGRDLHRYVRGVEETIICTLADMGITAERRPGLVGVWVGREKIASIGINVRKWVTTHGFAFNIHTDLSHFKFINPCGLPAVSMTSAARLLGRRPEEGEVRGRLASHFGRIFDLKVNVEPAQWGPLQGVLEEAGVRPDTHDSSGLLERVTHRPGRSSAA